MNLALFDATPHWSGGSKHVFLLAKELSKSGHNIFVVCLSGGLLSKKCINASINVLNINPITDVDPAAFLKIYSFIKKEKIQIVDLNSPKFYWLGTYAAKLAGAKIIITRNVPYRKKRLKKFINSKLLYALVDCVVALSEKINQQMVEDFSLDRIVTIYDGILQEPTVKSDIAALRKQMEITGQPVMGLFGRICEGKGHLYLIEALKEVKKKYAGIKLVVVGTGDNNYLTLLKKKIIDYGLENNVFFTGFQENVSQYYNAMDFVVAPTLNDCLPMNLLEACAAGKPVVASNVGGVPEIIQDGVSGTLVPPADPTALAAGILRLLASDLKEYGERARKIALEKFSLKRMITEYERLYSSLLVGSGLDF
jgi:glycosyltransferase involved in cell wall biosynthesis